MVGTLQGLVLFIISIFPFYHAGDIFDMPDTNYVPRYRPDFDLSAVPCDLQREHACVRPGKSYPWFGMQNYIRENQAMLKRMYGDTCEKNPTQTRAQGPLETRSQYARTNVVNACPSEQFAIAPFWANNSEGVTLALVNFHPFEQAVHQEVCKANVQGRCRDGCQCEQKYSWYKLLAFDPRNECKGIFMDWFQFPSCCTCRCYDLPSESHDDTTPSIVTNDTKPLDLPFTIKSINITTDLEESIEKSSMEITTPTTVAVLTTSTVTTTVSVASTPAKSSPIATTPATTVTTAQKVNLTSLTSSSNGSVTLSQSPVPTSTVANATLHFLSELFSSDPTAAPSATKTHRNYQFSSAVRTRSATFPPTKTIVAVSSTGKTTTTSPVTTLTADETSTMSNALNDDEKSTTDSDRSWNQIFDIAIRRNRIPRI